MKGMGGDPRVSGQMKAARIVGAPEQLCTAPIMAARCTLARVLLPAPWGVRQREYCSWRRGIGGGKQKYYLGRGVREDLCGLVSEGLQKRVREENEMDT